VRGRPPAGGSARDPRRRAAGEPWATRAERTGRSGRPWPTQADRAQSGSRSLREPGPARSRRRREAVRGESRPDPRGDSRAARAAPLRDHFRRRRRIAAVVLGIGFVVVAGSLGGRALLYDAGLADVEGLEITGLRTVPEPEVREAAAVTTGVPLAGVDLAALERRVERIPAVADAEAGRDWPHTLTLAVTERVPVAVTDTGRGPHLVDRSGKAFLPAPDPAALPRLAAGPVEPGAPATPAVHAALVVLAALPAPVREDVLTVEVGPPPALSVTVTLSKDRQVRWGSRRRRRCSARCCRSPGASTMSPARSSPRSGADDRAPSRGRGQTPVAPFGAPAGLPGCRHLACKGMPSRDAPAERGSTRRSTEPTSWTGRCRA
jgi:cell division protein FtsQ